MQTTQLFLTNLSLTFVNVLQGVILPLIRYSRVHILDGNYCPDGNMVKEIKFAHDMQCLIFCSKLSSCNGVFLHLDETKCVACSAKYFTKNDTHNSTIDSIFYKREISTGNEDTARVTVFWLLKQRMIWNDAKVKCEELGGHLATVKSEEQNNYIVQNVLAENDVDVWISCSGLGGNASTFKWLDGSSVSAGYTNWKSGQPYSPEGQVPLCVIMVPIWNYQWNDDKCENEMYSLCELEYK